MATSAAGFDVLEPYSGVEPDGQWQIEARKLAEEHDAVLLAHNYQLPEIQDMSTTLATRLHSAGSPHKVQRQLSYSAAHTSWRRQPKFSVRTKPS